MFAQTNASLTYLRPIWAIASEQEFQSELEEHNWCPLRTHTENCKFISKAIPWR